MRILFQTLTFLIVCTKAVAQDISFTYQSGLTSPVHRIIPIPGSNTYIIAERNGGILAWDIVSNKILHKISTANKEIADATYSAKDKKIFVAGETGIEILDASKLLTDHIIQPYHLYAKGRITALYWNESKELLRAATDKEELLNFSGINTLRNNKPSSVFSTGIPGIFAIRDLDNRICVLGRQKQAFFSGTGKLLFASTNNTTGLFGHAFHEKDSSIYIAHEANIVRLDYNRNRFTITRYNTGINDHGALVQGITINPRTNEVFAGTNMNTILSLSKNTTSSKEVFNYPDGSFTGLLIHEGKMLAGDFFGNVFVLDPAEWKKLFQLNEDATPSLNGVFLDRNRMVSTHFGLRGFAVKIWDLPTASLAKSFNVRGDIAYDVVFSEAGDTIYSAHTDDAIYQYYGDGGSFRMDTLLSASRPFMYGSIFFNVDLDKKSRREKNMKAFTSMLEEPGIHAFPADTANSTEIVFVNALKVPDECVQGKLPSNYRVPEAYLAALDLINESSGWDMLDKDLFYMRACSSPTLQMFLERVAEKGIDTVKAARFYRAIKGQEVIAPFFYIKSVSEEKTLQVFNRKQKPLYADISRMPEMALVFYADSLLVWNGKTGQTTSLSTGFSDMDFYYDFTERYVAVADSRSGSISLFSLVQSEKSSATKWFSFGEEDYLVHNKKGYYKIRGRSNRISFSMDKKPLSFQSFDLKYNRPDLVMENIGASDSILITAYRTAALKRIRRSGMNTAQPGTDMPVLDFANRDNISYQQQSDKLQLHISGGDNNNTIDRFNIWVNEVPLFGANGQNIRSQNRKAIDTTLEILLSPGENRIETSLTTTSGVESFRRPLRVNYKSNNTPPGMLYFIGIGIDHFKDSKYNLQYSVKDIRDLCLGLKEKYGNNISIDTLFNEQVTVENVRAFKKKLSGTGINDKVIISYSGHGLLNKDFDYFLSTYKVSFANPEEQGLPYSDLENLVDSIPARRKLIFIDACHSGEVDKEDLVTLNEITDSQVKGLKPVQHKKPQVGLKNSFELMQDLFLNIGKSTGATVISAAAGTQFALERNDLQNGVFTYSILEAMEKYPTIKVSELRKIVGERVVQLTNGRQVPTTRTETLSVDWNVW